jgi:GTP cyclohydrolase II
MLLRCATFIALALIFVHDTDASTSFTVPDVLRTNHQEKEIEESSSLRHPRRRKRAPTEDTAVKSNQIIVEDIEYISVPARSHETRFVAECNMPTALGNFKMRSYAYASKAQKLEPIVMVHGDIKNCENVIVRVHDQCFTSEVFGSLRCDCREQLHQSLKLVKEEAGVVIYLQQEGRGIGIANKVAAYSLQDAGLDTIDANIQLGFKDELREYLVVPDILDDLGIRSIRLITNNPFKINELTALGVHITDRIPMEIPSNEFNSKYMLTKRERMNHMFTPDSLSSVDLSLNKDKSINFGDNHYSNYPSGHVKLPVNTKLSGGFVESKSISESIDEPIHDISKGYAFGRHTVVAAIEAIRDGKVVLVTDDEGRENEGDLIMAAEKATADTIGFIVRYSSGVLCVSMENDRLEELKIPSMVGFNLFFFFFV